MKQILLLGAGKSATVLIEYLLDNAATHNWHVTVADADVATVIQKLKGHAHGSAVFLNAEDAVAVETLIAKSDLVISMLPAFMHPPVAKLCVEYGKHMLTASYVSPEVAALDEEAKAKGIVLLNEMGLDPGIDHMSAMRIIDHIRAKGGSITSFKSYTGGLVAPESNNNPWGYKFTWNPRNVIVAGQSTARYLNNGQLKFIPYQRLFTTVDKFEIENVGVLEGYPNRDSLSYIETYGLRGIQTMLRGTFRYRNYCRAWNCFVQLGLTDDSFQIANSEELSYKELVKSLLPEGFNTSLPSLINFWGLESEPEIFSMIEWTGILSDTKPGLKNASPAQMLQRLLEEKWKLQHGDLDLIVMLHEFECIIDNRTQKVTSTLVLKGRDEMHTAMAKTVGLPLAIAAKLILTGKITATGVKVPVEAAIYNPVLDELETQGIVFTENYGN